MSTETGRLNTIQKRNNLNNIYAEDAPGAGNASHRYVITMHGEPADVAEINFQHGPRNDPTSIHGVLDCDLLEIVRDRLKSFQAGEFATRENACALTHIEEALMWMNKRVEDRAVRGVLGTMQK